MEKKYQRITEGKIYPLLWRMAIPAMVGMMVSSLYNMTDVFFVGKLGRTDLTASVGIVFSFISIIQAIGFWFGYGSGNYISRQIGKNNIKMAENMAACAFCLTMAVSVVILIGGMFFLRPIAGLLGAGASEGLMEATVSYLRITLLAVPFMLASNVLYNQLRLQGSAGDSMLGLLVGMLINMVLDPVLILGLDLGVFGAALASLIGQMSGFCVLWWLTGHNGNIAIHIGRARKDMDLIREILTGGAPNFCRQGISSISTVLMNLVASRYGEAAIAGVMVASRILAFGYALVIGFGQGFQPICAINYGAGKLERVKRAFRDALITVTVFLVIAEILIVFKADRIVVAFSGEAAVREIGTSILRAQGMVLPFMGYYILIGMLLQNIGQFGRATLVTIAENGIFFIPAVWIMPVFWEIDGMIWCKPVAGICALFFSLFIGAKAWRKYLIQ